MSISSNKSLLGILTSVVAALFVAKALWVFTELKYLPKKGVDVVEDSGVRSLFYHYNLASKKEKPKPIVKHYSPKKVEVISKPKSAPKPKEVTKFTLKGIYNSKEKKVIIIEYLGQSYALSLGEELKGYKFVALTPTVATMKKDGKSYKLELYKKQQVNQSAPKPAQESAPIEVPAPKAINQAPKPAINPSQQASKDAPYKEGGTTYIPKSTFNKYKGNYAQIRRNINAIPNMENGKLNGFKVSFVRANSDFSKLGLKRGDIITAINGEPLNNFKVPLEFFNNIDTITAATLTVKRGNEIKELEYEVR